MADDRTTIGDYERWASEEASRKHPKGSRRTADGPGSLAEHSKMDDPKLHLLVRRAQSGDAAALELGTFRGNSRFRTWAYRVAANALLAASLRALLNDETSRPLLGDDPELN